VSARLDGITVFVSAVSFYLLMDERDCGAWRIRAGAGWGKVIGASEGEGLLDETESSRFQYFDLQGNVVPGIRMKASNKELVGASTAVLILGVLRRGSNYGYEIVRQINEHADGAFTWQEGTVYPVLHKLERDGLVRSRWEEAETGRKRKYYALTAAGRESLEEGTRQWQVFHQMIVKLTGVSHA